jgi:hypothetical protein
LIITFYYYYKQLDTNNTKSQGKWLKYKFEFSIRMRKVNPIPYGKPGYRLTPLGISSVNDIRGSFERCLYDWYNKYGISL